VRTLRVYCFGDPAGTLGEERSRLTFGYDKAWVDRGRPPLSQSLPLSGDFSVEAVLAFFAGLLPEGEPRRQLARGLGVSAGNDFALLEAVGGDCPGAISLYPPNDEPAPVGHGEDVEWLDDAGLRELLIELPTRPMLASPDGDIRLSLAGAQDKLPVVVAPDGRIGTTTGRTPSTHIIKTRIERLDGTVTNEAFCLRLGSALGVSTVEGEPRRALGTEYLLVTRYDREATTTEIGRLHQEDFCQALAVPSDRKYEAEGGPGFADCFELVRRAVTVPARAAVALLDVVGLNFVVGNHDAHGKNYSLLYRPDAVEIAPFYDILSTVAYRRSHNLSRKMAMKIGGEYRAEWVRERHFDRFFDDTGLGPGPSRRRLLQLATAAPPEAHRVARALRAEGWSHDVLDRITAVVEERSERLAEMMRPRPRPGRRGVAS
jgi:serine/threonine-protein kinase HipA